jgi:hypothetical protein
MNQTVNLNCACKCEKAAYRTDRERGLLQHQITYHVDSSAVLNGRRGHICHQIQQQLHTFGVAIERGHMQGTDPTICWLVHQPRKSAAEIKRKLDRT